MAQAGRARIAVLMALGASLSACSNNPDTPRPAAETGEEQRALAEAAEMLDERVTPDDAPSSLAPSSPVQPAPKSQQSVARDGNS